MMTTVKTDLGGKVIAFGAIESPMIKARRWTGAVRVWWIDYCTREGLRQTEDHVIHDAACQRTADGKVVPLNRR